MEWMKVGSPESEVIETLQSASPKHEQKVPVPVHSAQSARDFTEELLRGCAFDVTLGTKLRCFGCICCRYCSRFCWFSWS